MDSCDSKGRTENRVGKTENLFTAAGVLGMSDFI